MNEMHHEQIRHNLILFICYMEQEYNPAWYHELIAQRLTKFAKNEGPTRVILSMPSQHGKSTLTRYLCAFLLGNNPHLKILMVSYNQQLASKGGREIVEIMESPRFTELFPNCILPHKNQAKKKNDHEVEIEGTKGFIKFLGCGSSGAGYSADVLVIDDIHPDSAGANSPAKNYAVWEWYQGVAERRLRKTGRIMILATRWAQHDLIGRLLERDQEYNADLNPRGWLNSRFPALMTHGYPKDPEDPREAGEILWPAEFSLQTFLKARDNNPIQFNCIDQQLPSSQDGNLFKTALFNRITLAEFHQLQRGNQSIIHMFLDPAIRDSVEHDPSAILAACRIGKNLYVVDISLVRKTFVELLAHCKAFYKQHSNSANSILYIEPYASGPAIVDSIEKNSKSKMNVRKFKFTKQKGRSMMALDKVQRISSIVGPPLEAGRIFLVEGNYIEKFLAEAAIFPVGAHDDQLDCLGFAVDRFLVRREPRGVRYG